MENIVEYRIVDYEDLNGEWRNTDPKGQITTDGSRYGQGDPEPTTEQIENSSWVNVGFEDIHGDVTYKWIEGPFDEEFWVSDAIIEIAHEYGIVLGEQG